MITLISIYPCLCLCFGLREQITRTLPRLRIILQYSQIFFTELRTFIVRSSLIPVSNTATVQVVWGEFNRYSVTHQNPYIVHSHLT